ncbi:hypothetical protein RJ641_000824 [Dillenia turbinata]|uniref:60S ribosomal protein L24 n=1 Tax=Dillenia turbinata TaxID=194707 RepID=A0AAN8WG51_9MAGN
MVDADSACIESPGLLHFICSPQVRSLSTGNFDNQQALHQSTFGVIVSKILSFLIRKQQTKLTWSAMYRKQHKKDIAAEAIKKRRRTTKKPYSRSIVGATLEVIQNRRTEKREVRDAAREAALREIKERVKKTKGSQQQTISLSLSSSIDQ